MLVINKADVKRILENRKDQVKAKLKNLPNDPKLRDAHNCIKHNIGDYLEEIDIVLSLLKYSECDIYLATDKRRLKMEKKAVDNYKLTAGEWVEIWVMSVYNDDTDTGRDYYVIYCRPLSEI